MATSTAIPVSDAATQLGLSEEEFRKLLKGIYKNPKTLKKISLENFKLFAESMQARATEELEPEVEDIDTEPLEEVITTLESDLEIDDINIDVIDEVSTDLETEPVIEEKIEQNLEESVSLATTDSEALDIPQDKAITQLNINLNLSNQVLDLNKISSALAIVAGEAAVKNFEEIYTHTFNTGVDRVLENFAHRTYDTIQQLREVQNSDFLMLNNRETSTINTQAAIDLVSQFL